MQVVTRKHFLRKFMLCGMTYDQACRCYSAMVSVIEDGVVRGNKVGIGKVGALIPTVSPPRDYTMGFQRVKGNKVVKTKRTYHTDERVRYRFNLFRNFRREHDLGGS